MKLTGKVALITGGGKNLGAAVAELLGAQGASLALHYHSEKTKPEAEKLASSLQVKGVAVKLFNGDLTKPANVKALFEGVLKEFGKIDIVVHTVGMVLKKQIVDISPEEYDLMFDINTKANFFVLQEAAKTVSQGGFIVSTVTSLLAAFTPFYGLYQGSKAPVEYFTKTLSKELMGKSISVNSIAPGPMDTPFFYGQETPEAVAFHKSNAMDGRLTDVNDIAPIVEFLVTSGKWITGQTLFANGGYTAR